MGIEARHTEVFAPGGPPARLGDGLVDVPGQSLPDPPGDRLELAAVLHALSDPMRLRIVIGLAKIDDRPCGSFDLPVTKSTCTHHFKVLARPASSASGSRDDAAELAAPRRPKATLPGLLDSVLRASGC